MIKDAKDLTPHELAAKFFNIVTYGNNKSSREILRTGMYGRFLILGAFLYVNSECFNKASRQDVMLLEARTVGFVNKLLALRYGPEMLPGNLHLIRPLWQRGLFKSEQEHVNQLKNWIPDADEDTYKHAMLLVLGVIEFTRRHYYDLLDKGLDGARELARFMEIGNEYIFKVAGIPDFFEINTIQKSIFA